jgi:FkbM family methyltransferase
MDLRETLRNKTRRDHWPVVIQPIEFKAEVANIEGETILMHPSDMIGYLIMADEQYYEFNMMDMFWDYIPFEGTFLDIGANIGNHALMFNRFRPDVTIHCFEPIFKNYVLLNENAKDKPNIKTYHVGLGSTNEVVKTSQPHVNNAGGIKVDKQAGEGETIIIIPGDTMNFIWATFIKIDVEGYELNVLRGLNNTITTCSPNIWIEDFDGEAVEWLKQEHGYEVVLGESDGGNYMMIKQ